MIVVPAATPFATPVTGLIVATEVLLLLHVPPGIGLKSEVVLPAHIFIVPDTTVGDASTVTIVVVIAVPQLLFTV